MLCWTSEEEKICLWVERAGSQMWCGWKESGEEQIGLVSNGLLVAPCYAPESKTLDSLSKWNKTGVVSNVGYFRVWGWVVGCAQCRWYQVLEYLPATAIISSWHPSGENSSSWMLLVSEQIGCDCCCIKQGGSFELVWVFFHSSRKLSGHFIAILVEKSVTMGLECWACSWAGLASGVISLSDPNEIFRVKCKSCGGKWIEILKWSRNSAVCSSLRPSLLIGQICQLSAIKQPFYFFTARHCFNSLKAFCCGYKLKVWCSLQQH